jgi:hypothetical protein
VATLRPHARRDPLGRVQVDIPGPEASLTTTTPIGAHLVLLLDDARAAELAASLAALLGPRTTTAAP